MNEKIYVLVKWDEAKVKLFESKVLLMIYLKRNKLMEIASSTWSKSFNKYEAGEYYSIFEEEIIKDK